eukprot:TRINITY_DN12353_c0_g1_i2.p1 TRINITY_DN12353_c0_g1~~TRINITY_DN12353_c0_g1_i2.p1  ORF type:complete len:385 (+),score=87.70 TRINITY_DN12353_c0_g1_i2:95-1249(+)
MPSRGSRAGSGSRASGSSMLDQAITTAAQQCAASVSAPALARSPESVPSRPPGAPRPAGRRSCGGPSAELAAQLRQSLAAAGIECPSELYALAAREAEDGRGGTAFDSRLREAGCPQLPQGVVTALCRAVSDQRLDASPPPGGRAVVVFTAPHNLYLCRDFCEDHPAEEHTSLIAQGFATAAGAGHLTWAKREQRRVNPGKRGCPTNRDPNFLQPHELQSSAWSQRLRALRGSSQEPSLHCDIHGCMDPETEPHFYRAHLHAGLGAMEEAGCPDVARLRAQLEAELTAVLGPRGFIVDCHPSKLTGAWTKSRLATAVPGGHAGPRMTVAQQALAHGYTHAVQLELARSLRLALRRDDEFSRAFATAVTRAWTQTVTGRDPQRRH